VVPTAVAGTGLSRKEFDRVWVVYGLLPPLVFLTLIVGAVVAVVRGRAGEGWNIQFSGVLAAYAALVMLISVFLVAAGAGALVKAGLAEAFGRDFSYDTAPYPQYREIPVEPVRTPAGEATPSPADEGTRATPDAPVPPQPERWIDPSDNAIRDDVATGITLTFVGAALFAIHAVMSVALRRRGAQGERLIARAYNLLGLATSTIGFLALAAMGLNDIVRRYVVEGGDLEPWQVRHPGEHLGFAIAFLPLALWFGWRVWQEFTMETETAA
jgi:hypothetical protein